MKRLILSMLAWGISSTALAQNLPDVTGVCTPEVTHRRATVEHQGDPGVWFHRSVSLCMLSRLRALPLYADRVVLLEGQLSLSSERHALLVEAIEVGEDIERRYSSALTAATRRANSAERELGTWYRAPVLWALLGSVVTGAVVALSAYSLSATAGP